jgi:hypothetical protein
VVGNPYGRIRTASRRQYFPLDLSTFFYNVPCESTHMKIFRNLLAVLVVTVIAIHPLYGPPNGGSPEIDPGMSMAALALLSGAILVIRGRVKL